MKKFNWKCLVAMVTVGVMALSVAACGETNGGSDGAATTATTKDNNESSAVESGGTLKVGIYGGLDSLNPWTSGRITKEMVTYTLYETLASCQSGSTEIDYILMKDYQKIDDNTFDIEIYDYIKDSAGNAVTAEDVVFSFEKYDENWATTIDTIKAVDATHIELKLNTTAAGAFEYIVCKVPIAAKAAFEASQDGFATTACGTLPYTVSGGNDYVSGTTIILRKTAEYWQTDESKIYEGSRAYADVIEFDILEEATQLANAVENGDVHVAMYINPSMIADVEAADGISMVQMPSTEDRGFQFCMTKDSIFYDNLELRQAILYAIDNEAVAEGCGYGYGTPADVMCGSEQVTVGFNKEWKTSPYAYDPEKAKELLKQSGYKGETIRLLCNSNATITMMWTIVQENLKAVGINAELNVIEGTTYGAYRDGTSGQYELCYAGPGNGGYVTSDLWNTLFNRNNYDSGATWAGLEDDKLQELYDAIAAPDGYTQENIDAMYNYIEENALYYEIYNLPEYVAYREDSIAGYFTDWNRFIRANAIQIK